MSRKLYAYDTCGGIFFRDHDAPADNRRPEFDLEFDTVWEGSPGYVRCSPDKPKTKTVERWINVYATHVTSWPYKQTADDNATASRLECIHFKKEVPA